MQSDIKVWNIYVVLVHTLFCILPAIIIINSPDSWDLSWNVYELVLVVFIVTKWFDRLLRTEEMSKMYNNYEYWHNYYLEKNQELEKQVKNLEYDKKLLTQKLNEKEE